MWGSLPRNQKSRQFSSKNKAGPVDDVPAGELLQEAPQLLGEECQQAGEEVDAKRAKKVESNCKQFILPIILLLGKSSKKYTTLVFLIGFCFDLASGLTLQGGVPKICWDLEY